jgi:hypothetical protein
MDYDITFVLDMIYIILFSIVLAVALLMVKGIDDMIDNHPDYKGDDLF